MNESNNENNLNNANVSKKKRHFTISTKYFTPSIRESLKTILSNATNQTKSERSKSVKALLLTIVIVTIIILIFIKVPFIAKFLGIK